MPDNFHHDLFLSHSAKVAAAAAVPVHQCARRTGEKHQLLLAHYGLERLMYRLRESPARDRFVFKGRCFSCGRTILFGPRMIVTGLA